MVGFEGKYPSDPGVQALARQIRQGHVGGVVLFGYNIGTPEETRVLVAYLQSQASLPLLVAVDQEGGTVARIRSPKFPSAKNMAQETPAVAETLYTAMANTLKEHGINVVFGPVVDVDHIPPSPVIGGLSRSYSKDPDVVVTYANRFIAAMHEAQIATTLKHFPGHGSAQGDTHEGMVDTTDVWSERELIPYQKMTTPDLIMVAHIVNRTLDPSGRPASLSHPIVTGLLRNQLGYQGLTITDDLHMQAIRANYTLEETVRLAVMAGNDILLFGNNTVLDPKLKKRPLLSDNMIHILTHAIAENPLFQKQIDTAYDRIMKLKRSLVR